MVVIVKIIQIVSKKVIIDGKINKKEQWIIKNIIMIKIKHLPRNQISTLNNSGVLVITVIDIH